MAWAAFCTLVLTVLLWANSACQSLVEGGDTGSAKSLIRGSGLGAGPLQLAWNVSEPLVDTCAVCFTERSGETRA